MEFKHFSLSRFFLVSPIFNFENTKYIIEVFFHREFIKEKDKTVNELMDNYSSNPARGTTTSDAHQKC